MESLVLDLNKRYTYADYLTWTDDKMRELFNGFIRFMSPAPKLKHQKINGILFVNLFKIIENSKCKCEVFSAPFDVRLPENGEKADEQIYNVVQPDICVICDQSKLDENGCIGAPDLIVEIISKSSERRDAIEKKALYEKVGVKEYWIVYPNDEIIHVYILLNEKYEYHNVYGVDDKIPVHTLNGYEINMCDIFKKMQ